MVGGVAGVSVGMFYGCAGVCCPAVVDSGCLALGLTTKWDYGESGLNQIRVRRDWRDIARIRTGFLQGDLIG